MFEYQTDRSIKFDDRTVRFGNVEGVAEPGKVFWNS